MNQSYLADVVGQVQNALDQVYELSWPIVAALAGVGIATMAIWQMVKDVCHVHQGFNRRRVREWLLDRASQAIKHHAEAKELSSRYWEGATTGDKTLVGPGHHELASACCEQAEKSLVGLATAGDGDALYSLEIGRLAGQINVAARMALDLPTGHEALIYCLAVQAENEDLKKVLSPPPSYVSRMSDEQKKELRDLAGPYLEAKNRVASQIQRTLDGFQIMVEYRWKRWNQLWAFGLNFFFVMLVWLIQGTVLKLPAFLLVALLGGFVAPVAKDLVSALEALKGRRR